MAKRCRPRRGHVVPESRTARRQAWHAPCSARFKAGRSGCCHRRSCPQLSPVPTVQSTRSPLCLQGASGPAPQQFSESPRQAPSAPAAPWTPASSPSTSGLGVTVGQGPSSGGRRHGERARGSKRQAAIPEVQGRPRSPSGPRAGQEAPRGQEGVGHRSRGSGAARGAWTPRGPGPAAVDAPPFANFPVRGPLRLSVSGSEKSPQARAPRRPCLPPGLLAPRAPPPPPLDLDPEPQPQSPRRDSPTAAARPELPARLPPPPPPPRPRARLMD